MAALGTADSVLRVELLSLLALELSRQPRSHRLVELVEEAVAMAGRVADPAAELTALAVRNWVLLGPDIPMQDRLATGADLVGRAIELGDTAAIWQNRLVYLSALVESGQLAAADACAETIARAATETGTRGPIPWITAYRGMREWISGSFESADQLTNQALQEALSMAVDPRSSTMTVGAQLLAQRSFRDGLESFIPLLQQMANALPGAPALSAFLAFAHCELGEGDKAHATLAGVAAKDFADLPRDGNWLGTLWPLSLACASLADRDRAAVLLELLRPCSDRWVISLGLSCLGPVATLVGLLATTLGRYDEAERYLQQGLAGAEAAGARTFVTHAEREYGVMLLARQGPDDAARARPLLSRALASADELGMRTLAARIRADLAAG
jgi:tetratricopeptide (TPR) repeat protein